MFVPLENMTRGEKEAERDQLADFLARHRNCTRERVLNDLFKPAKIGRPFTAEVTRAQMQLRVKHENFERGKRDGDICAEDMVHKKGTCAYNRAVNSYWKQCCLAAPGYETVIAPGLFTYIRGLGWIDKIPPEIILK